ncbi:MAG: hypothetical protein JW720_05305 [Sedimentisphaerales bacterium]|nr:hypothetical protein [Sedimentisphaerales bacterium]
MRKHRVFLIALVCIACCLFVGVYCLAEKLNIREGHVVPIDKKLSRSAVKRMFARGERLTWADEDANTIGMPVGGIAAGQLYLRGDGTLGQWWIFNKHNFTGYGATCYRTYTPESPVDSGFAVVIKQDDGITARKLDRDFGKVEFAGEYPIGLVRYSDRKYPVKVEMEAFSPFIPLNTKDSALPATLFHITVENTSSKSVQAGILGYLENPVCIDSAPSLHALRRTRIVTQQGSTMIVHTAEKAPPLTADEQARAKVVLADFEGPDYGDWKAAGEAFGSAPAKGTLAAQQEVSGFAGKGLVNTYLGGDGPHGTLTSPPFEISRKFLSFLIGGGSHKGRTCMNLIIDGKVVRTAVGKDNEKLEWRFWSVEDFMGKSAVLQIVDSESGGWGHINIDQIELTDKPNDIPIGELEDLPDYGSLALACRNQRCQTQAVLDSVGGWAAKFNAKPDITFPVGTSKTTAMATQPGKLAPGEKRTWTFVLTWFMPNFRQGHEYANRFNSAAEVADYVLDNHDHLAGDTRKWHQTFYEDSTLPRWLLFRLHSTVCNLATGTCQWWKNGRFWAWEGVGCCEGTCTHVWNYAHAVARLFPELERSAREMQDFGEGFDENSGLIGFRSNRAYAADGQCGTVLKAYREHLMSADEAFLKRNWPRIKKALEFSIKQDGNDDGLIENSQHNTFDINFEGANTFVGSLYLAALRAGEEMARERGDVEFAMRCRRIFESGKKLSVERLWDGEYFIEEVDLTKHPKFQYEKGCLSDQLFGQGWAELLGLGYIYPQENVRAALESIWRYNWTPDIGPYNVLHKPERWFARDGEAGLFTCTWPKSTYLPDGVRYKNEIWTGIEYQAAGHMVAEGMVEEAVAICDGIQDRYHPAKHNPFNEVECGDHYARAFASWGVYANLAGYEYHGPKGHLGFAPKITPEDFRAAFTAAEGWGTFAQTRKSKTQHELIDLRWGSLTLKSLAFEVPENFTKVKVNIAAAGKSLDCDHTIENGRIEIILKNKLALKEGQALAVTIQR